MKQLQKIIKFNSNLVYKPNAKLSDNIILSKNKNSPLSFIEITQDKYRFVFDKLDHNVKDILIDINNESKNNNRINIENLIWCGGGITITYKYN